MPSITNQEKLLRDYDLTFISKGPKDHGWIGHYLKCPLCGYFVLKGKGYDQCICGNISIDSDMLRVTVSSPESEVETYNATRKIKDVKNHKRDKS